MLKNEFYMLLLVVLFVSGFTSTLYAHDNEHSHAHVGGGLSHPPHAFFMTTWYRDIVYDASSADTSQTSLDIYVNHPVEAASPVLVWVHGGGYMAGDKAHSKELDPKPEFFSNRMDFIFVSTNYRLMPAGRYPHGVQDLANALAWVKDNIAEFGGDPSQIYLMGHSAGANMAAQLATNDEFLKRSGKNLDLLKGVILVDGNAYDLKEDDINPGVKAYYGEQWRTAQATSNVASDKNTPPFLLMHVAGGSNLGTNTEEQATTLAKALWSANIRAEVVALEGVEHFGANDRIGDPDHPASIAVEEFLLSLPGTKKSPEWKSMR
ncbi:MAG: carboxylesterase family protein [Gammaproteobacteria bacterium]|nr:carboxylesterase family protein [Gammaproteobacteria bacterium]